MAITALVLGIVGLCLSWVLGLGLVLGVAAIILGVLGMKQCDQDPAVTGKGMGIAGLVLGIITVLIGLIVLVLVLFFGVALQELADDLEETSMTLMPLLMR